MFEPGAAYKQHHHPENKNHHTGAEIRLEHHEQDNASHPQHQRQKSRFEIIKLRPFHGKESTQMKHERELCRFGGLQIESAETEPSRRPFYFTADRQRKKQEHKACDERKFCQLLVILVIDAHCDEHRSKADQHFYDVFVHQPVCRTVFLERPRRRSTIHHHRARYHQEEHNNENDSVNMILLRLHLVRSQ